MIIEERESMVPKREAGQSSRLHPETKDVVESGPSREDRDGEGKGKGKGEGAIQVNPPAPIPSISYSDSGKPDST
jgi:hypothetical protein